MRNPAYAPYSRSGATIAHPSMTKSCHNGRGLRSTGIVPIRKMIPAATQSRPADRRRAVERVDAGHIAEQGEHRKGAGDAAKHGRGEAVPLETAERERAARERKCQRRHFCDPE